MPHLKRNSPKRMDLSGLGDKEISEILFPESA